MYERLGRTVAVTHRWLVPMVLDRREMAREEIRRLSHIYAKNERKLLSAQWIPAPEIFPEFQLTQPRGLFIPVAPVSAFFPFYRQLIALILPFREPDQFRRYYSISLEEMCSLVREERVIPLLDSRYEDFPEWYDPLFSISHIPLNRTSSIRVNTKWGPVSGDAIKDVTPWVQILTPAKKKFTRINLEALPAFREGLSEYSPRDFSKVPQSEATRKIVDPLFADVPDSHRQLMLIAYGAATDLVAFGYEKVYQDCLALDPPEFALEALRLSKRYLCLPHYSLDGWNNEDPAISDHVGLLSTRIRYPGPAPNVIHTAQTLMAELSIRLGYGHPENYSPLEFINKIDKKNVDDNHRILLDVQKHLEKLELQRAFDRVHEAREVMKNVDKEIAGIARNYKIARFSIYPAFSLLSATGVGSLLSTIPEIAAFVGFPMVATGVISALATATLNSLKENLKAFAKGLVSNMSGRNSAPVLIWRRENP